MTSVMVRVVGRVGLVVLVVGIVGFGLADLFTVLPVASYAAIGAFLVDRRPRNPIGWLLLVNGFCFAATTDRPGVDVEALAAGTAPWTQFLPAWVSTSAGNLSFVCFGALAFVFPSGMLPTGRWGLVVRVLLAAAVLVACLPLIAPSFTVVDGDVEITVPNLLSPLGADASYAPPPAAVAVTTLIPLVVAVVGVADLLRRYRRSAGTERLQMRWLLASVALVIGAVLLGITLFTLAGPQLGFIAWLPALVSYPTVGIAIGVAVLRYRLFDIDRLVSRTVSWALVSGGILVVFAALVVGLQAVLADVTNGATLAIAMSTLVAAALFQPVRQGVQRAVDRRFDRAHYDAQQTAQAFADRLRDEVDLDALADELERTVVGAIRPTAATLWLPGRGRVEAGGG